MKNLHALVIDDDINFTDLMRMRLESWGHEVTVAHNWLSAMMLMGKVEFDVMLIDVDTPTGNGLTACRDLSVDPRIAGTPKVFITGCSAPETLQRCRDLGAQYIHKAARVFEELQKILEVIEPQSIVAEA